MPSLLRHVGTLHSVRVRACDTISSRFYPPVTLIILHHHPGKQPEMTGPTVELGLVTSMIISLPPLLVSERMPSSIATGRVSASSKLFGVNTASHPRSLYHGEPSQRSIMAFVVITDGLRSPPQEHRTRPAQSLGE